MARYRQETDTLLKAELDPGFTGVDARRDPGVIRTFHSFYDINQEIQGPGTASSAKNGRFARGHFTTRGGVCAPLQFNPSEVTAADCVGSGIFSDPDGSEWTLLALVGESNIVAVRDNETRQLIPIPEAPAAGEDWHIIQTFNGALILRGLSKTPWSWNGNFGSSFGAITVAGTSPGYIDPLPGCSYGVVAANRVWAVSSRDQVVVSDSLDYTSYDSDLNTLRINEGSDDKIVSLAVWRKNSIVVFKEQSIALITNINAISSVAVETLNMEIGIAGKHAWANLGGDIVFLSRKGQLFRLTEAIETVKAVQEQALSEPMEPLFEEIDGNQITKATVAVHGRYLYCSVPTYDSTNNENNRTFVWDAIDRRWQGYDYVSTEQGGVFDPRRFHQTDYLGKKRLIGVHYSGGTGAMVAVIDENLGDDLVRTSAGHVWHGINSYMKTRGYTFGEYGISKVRHCMVAVDVWNATLSIKSQTEGVEEETALITGRTFSRTNYVTWGTPDWDQTNTNDDWANPKREDYHVRALDTDAIQCGASGFTLTQHQSHFIPVRPKARDRWTSFSVESSTGSIKIKTVAVEGFGSAPKEKTYA